MDGFRTAAALDPELPWKLEVDAIMQVLQKLDDGCSGTGPMFKAKRLAPIQKALTGGSAGNDTPKVGPGRYYPRRLIFLNPRFASSSASMARYDMGSDVCSVIEIIDRDVIDTDFEPSLLRVNWHPLTWRTIYGGPYTKGYTAAALSGVKAGTNAGVVVNVRQVLDTSCSDLMNLHYIVVDAEVGPVRMLVVGLIILTRMIGVHDDACHPTHV